MIADPAVAVPELEQILPLPPGCLSDEDSEFRTVLADVLHRLTERTAAEPDWTLKTDNVWTFVRHCHDLPDQGWKLHVSATVGSAAEVLRRCAEVLVAAGCDFKFAKNQSTLVQLVAGYTPRANAGKFLTAYPRTAATARALAAALDEVTYGLPGPRVLSDQPFRPNSLVHYRFGVFGGVPHLDEDGHLRLGLRAPNGDITADGREIGGRPPGWIQPLFEPPARVYPARAAAPKSVRLGDRYTVSAAVRHAYRGGVFRGTDISTGQAVIIKQARAHVDAGVDGRDVRDRLRREADALRALSGLAAVPCFVDLLERDCDVFLVESAFSGGRFRDWIVPTEPVDPAGPVRTGAPLKLRRAPREVLAVLIAAGTALAAIHRRGMVVRDFNPNNLVVDAEGDQPRVGLVDFESARFSGSPAELAEPGGTPAFAAPEQWEPVAPDQRVDSYAFGATILFAFTGEDPYLWMERVHSVSSWLDWGRRRDAVPPEIAELAVALCDPDPARRPTIENALAVLRAAHPTAPHRERGNCRTGEPQSRLQPLSDAELDAAIGELTERLLSDVRPAVGRVAEMSIVGQDTNPSNLHHGAAGLLGVLVQGGKCLADDRLVTRAEEVADWLVSYLEGLPTGGPVGLHFGAGGPCWSLAEAGIALGRDDLVDRAVNGALALPIDWPAFDVTHGIAGLGLTLARLWQLTGRPEVRDRLVDIGARLVARCEFDANGISWRTPASRSVFSGLRNFGFAHGTAGIALFLAHAAEVTGEDIFIATAAQCAESLTGSAAWTDRAASWGVSPDRTTPLMPYWCAGSSGIGTFLVRWGQLGGQPTDALLRGAARAVEEATWTSGISYCHGLAGNADFLLDLAQFTDPTYQEDARRMLAVAWERRVLDEKGRALTDEPGHVSPDFGTGYSGALAVMLRARYGTDRIFYPSLPQ